MNKLIYLPFLIVLLFLSQCGDSVSTIPLNNPKKVLFYNQDVFLNENNLLNNVAKFNLTSSAECSNGSILCFFSILDSTFLEKNEINTQFESFPNVCFKYLKEDSTLISVSSNFYIESNKQVAFVNKFHFEDSVRRIVDSRKSQLYDNNVVNCEITFKL